ncbi:hypothetical protein [Kribbella solani]|uniref:Spore-associated protein A n=1 Tax=Kribbella solani TaxID=236067 RepID=A0A841DP29_9ACTN|nr:hypothetical protein [Kribbella solani]MBB5979651.1 hypothetical protein [Kribbella solani]MDX3004656.1 hypothetical protein [Kribbella solani]
MRKLVSAVAATAAAAAGLMVAAPAQASTASTAACDLVTAKSVGYSASMLFVAVGLEGCSNSVTEVRVELQKGASASGPFSTVAETYAYSGGGAWFDGGTGCGYYVGVAHWQNQTETTPTPAYYCN